MALTSYRITVTNVATLLASADGVVQKEALLRNTDSVLSVFLGAADVTPSTGFELRPGEAVSMGLGYHPSESSQVYAVASSNVVVDIIIRLSM